MARFEKCFPKKCMSSFYPHLMIFFTSYLHVTTQQLLFSVCKLYYRPHNFIIQKHQLKKFKHNKIIQNNMYMTIYDICLNPLPHFCLFLIPKWRLNYDTLLSIHSIIVTSCYLYAALSTIYGTHNF